MNMFTSYSHIIKLLAIGTFDNHGPINDTVSLQSSHIALLIYINTDSI